MTVISETFMSLSNKIKWLKACAKDMLPENDCQNGAEYFSNKFWCSF